MSVYEIDVHAVVGVTITPYYDVFMREQQWLLTVNMTHDMHQSTHNCFEDALTALYQAI